MKKSSHFFKSSLIFLFLLFASNTLYSQSTLDSLVDYNKDSRSLVFMLNSNGYSVGFRFSKRLDGFKSRLIDLDVAWVRHSKEQRIASLYSNQSKFVFGKLNQLFSGRVGYGRQKELYGKYAASGIAINFYYTIGASIGLLKPVYFDVVKNAGTKDQYVETEKFNKDEIYNSAQIYGGASFFKGFDEIVPVFGGYIKLAFSFDINKRYKAINTLELGAIIDIYHQKLPMMEYVEQHPYIFTMFIAYRFGKKRDKRINNQ